MPSGPVEWTDALSDGQISVRRLLPADAPAFAQAFRDDPRLGDMIGVETDPTEADAVNQATEEPQPGRLPPLAIAAAGTDEFLGAIGLYVIDLAHRRAELGVWLAPRARGRGVASTAVALLTTYAFDTLGLDRVELTTTPDNTALRALAAKLGFKEEGVMRSRNFERGRRVDILILAALEDEWPPATIDAP